MRTTLLFVVCSLFSAAFAWSQPATGVLHGLVTTQSGTVKLPGVAIVVKDSSAREVAQVLCGEDGSFRIELPAGLYRVDAALPGFVTRTKNAVVVAARTVEVPFDLPIEGIATSIDVVATNPVVRGDGMLSPVESIGSREMDQFAPSGGLQASLRLLASIIEVPGGVSIKGGRPAQAGVQLGPSSLVDTATGLSPMSLPDDAVDSVEVLPNPYAVEYGRFSSGLVVIQTRRAGDKWKVRLNNLDPSFRTKRGSPVNLYGVQWWAPRLEVGGPIVKDRLFIEQTAQYRYRAADVPSLPPDLLRISHSFSSFTRVDANLSPRQMLVVSGGTFPGVSRQDTLGTFTPPAATIDLHAQANEIAMTERALWTDSLFSETTAHAHAYETEVTPQGTAPMQLQPETTLGNFFNEQHRQTRTVQLIETLSGTRAGFGGLHLFKLGVDLLYSSYEGSSVSRPVIIERSNGSVARRLDFIGPRAQSVNSSDLAFFAQDRFQPNTRWYLEFGGRVDRDGIVGRFNITPRVGTALLLTASGNAVLRGGFGLFYERTPSTAGTFDQFETAVDSRFAADGVTPIGPPIAFIHTTVDLETPRSRTWDIGYDHRLNSRWAFHLSAVDRSGTHELVLDPLQDGAAGELRLSSTGRSSYRGAEAGIQYTRGPSADLKVTYARSFARGDLNTFANYYDTVRSPVFETRWIFASNANSAAG